MPRTWSKYPNDGASLQSQPRGLPNQPRQHEIYPLGHLGSLQYKYLSRSDRLYSLTNFTSIKSSLHAIFKKASSWYGIDNQLEVTGQNNQVTHSITVN